MQTIQLSQIDIANQIAAALKATGKKEFIRPNVWSKNGVVRVYTNYRGEYFQVEANGTSTRSRTNMAWSQIFPEMFASIGITENL